jgi:hypothetical protein
MLYENSEAVNESEGFLYKNPSDNETQSVLYENYLNNLLKLQKNIQNNNGYDINYIRVFNSRGVYGLVGISDIPTKNQFIYKIGNDINRNLIHENIILNNLNKLKFYCPHFVYCFDKKFLNISEDFIYEPFEFPIFCKDINSSLPREIIYLEELQKMPLYKFIKFSDNKCINSVILQILMAIQISQNHCQLTHYDLHMGNILIQQYPTTPINDTTINDTTINNNKLYKPLHIYKYKNNYYCIPTYGYYPVIIDTGISYSNSLNGYQMCSNTDSYDYGFQSTLFDKLNDVHHFLLNLFYELEIKNDGYDCISNKIKNILKYLPVLRKSGWKKLPFDITDIVLLKLKNNKNYKNLLLFKDYKSEMLELINGLIKLPLQDYGDSDLNCFDDFIIELQNCVNYNKFIEQYTENQLLFVIKSIIDVLFNAINNNTDVLDLEININNILNKFPITSVNTNDEINEVCDYNNLLINATELSKNLSTNYYRIRSKHQEIIDICYQKTIIKNPLDIIIYFYKHLNINYNVSETNDVLIWDIDNKSYKQTQIKLTTEIINKINILPMLERGNELIKYI